MFSVIITVKLIAEIALVSLLGQWVLGMLAGHDKERNLIYQSLCQIVRPFVAVVRFVVPRVVLERHHPLVAFCLLGFVWAIATFFKIEHCLKIGIALCQQS